MVLKVKLKANQSGFFKLFSFKSCDTHIYNYEGEFIFIVRNCRTLNCRLERQEGFGWGRNLFVL